MGQGGINFLSMSFERLLAQNGMVPSDQQVTTLNRVRTFVNGANNHPMLAFLFAPVGQGYRESIFWQKRFLVLRKAYHARQQYNH